MLHSIISLALLIAAPISDGAGTSVRVAYGDLNLSSTAGRAELDRRLARAVDAACKAPDSKYLGHIQAVAACRAKANENASEARRLALGTAKN